MSPCLSLLATEMALLSDGHHNLGRGCVIIMHYFLSVRHFFSLGSFHQQ